jgi:hypothetical protein
VRLGGTNEIFITVTHYYKPYRVSFLLKVGLSGTRWDYVGLGRSGWY